MSTLLLEVFSDEIPAGMQQDAAEKFQKLFNSQLHDEFGISVNTKSWVTPRRLGIYVTDIPTKIDAVSEEVRGPKTTAPEAALNGFLNKYSAKKESLEVKGDYYSLMYTKPAVDIRHALKTAIESTMKKFVWPKSMKWGDFQETWVRPIHSILCLYNSEILPITYGDIVASNLTKCHRFIDSDKTHSIHSYNDYLEKMEKGGVILDHQMRKDMILNQAHLLIKDKGLKLIQDEGLLNEIAGLVEHPHVLVGTIDQKLMELPRELLIITLKHHQRYLMLENLDKSLAPHYIIVSNIIPSDRGETIIKGNNKVLKARLNDASFFYESDKKTKLIDRVERLKKLTFHQQIGTVYDKTQSVLRFSKTLSSYFNISEELLSRAILLSKADLVSEMVKEFPELQGVMGYYYALNDKEDADVAIAVRDQYKPVGPNDALPQNTLGKALAVADKLDTLNQLFAINIKPTGSKDPFALRRAANGIIRIVEEANLDNFFSKLKTQNLLREDVMEYIKDKKI